jgi:hypothetical protein
MVIVRGSSPRVLGLVIMTHPRVGAIPHLMWARRALLCLSRLVIGSRPPFDLAISVVTLA